METEAEKQSFIELRETARAVIVGELVHCRMCGKLFKPYKVKTLGRECDSTICKACREECS